MDGEMVETDFLVLRTSPCNEYSLVASGISPELGRLSFMVHGAQTSGRRGGCPFGLFRRLRVSYVPRERELQQCSEVEFLKDHSGLCADYSRYSCGCWVSQFCLANVLPGMSSSCFFESVDIALGRLASGGLSVAAIQTGLLMVYMVENGLQPMTTAVGREREQCQALLDMGLGQAAPSLTDENWVALRDWVCSILRGSDCIVPVP